MKSKRSKACNIPQSVKMKVWERDNGKCIACASHYAFPNAHYIPRSKGGLGIEENIVTLCLICHREYDFTDKRKDIGIKIKSYLKAKYFDWNEEKLIYRKW